MWVRGLLGCPDTSFGKSRAHHECRGGSHTETGDSTSFRKNNNATNKQSYHENDYDHKEVLVYNYINAWMINSRAGPET